MELTNEQAERILAEIKECKSSAVMVTELIERFRTMDDDDIYVALAEIRYQIEIENEVHRMDREIVDRELSKKITAKAKELESQGIGE